MKSLITGATGYLGSHLAAHLDSLGHEVHALVRPTSDTSSLPERTQIHVLDGTPKQLAEIVFEIEPGRVFHLAADQSLDVTESAIEHLVSTNILLGTHLAHACSILGVRAFVNTGTYWQRREGLEYSPTTLYAASKQAFADMLTFFAQSESLPAITLELPGTYGPSDQRGKLVSAIAHAVASGVTLELSPGDQILDLVHVRDVARGFACAADLVERKSSHRGLTYALHADEQPTLRELTRMLREMTGRELPVRLGALPYRPLQMMRPTVTPALPGWKPETTLREGLSEFPAFNRGSERGRR